MSSSPPPGSDPNILPPPRQSGVPTTWPDREAGLALAGFLCGLGSFSTLGLVGIFAIGVVAGLARGDWATLAMLFLTAFLVALVGLILSAQGRQSTSRRRLAIVGVVLCSIVMVVFFVGLPVILHIWATPGPNFH